MQDIFYKRPEEYTNKLNPVSSYLEQLTQLTMTLKSIPEEEALPIAKDILKKHFQDKPLKYFQHQENGDREVENTTLLSYINENIKNDNILVPTFTSYVNAKVRPSVLSKFIGINVKERAIAKKEGQAAKARGDIDLAISKNNEQNNRKIKNNSVSGLFGQKGSILYNPTAHSTLTSVTRTVTSLANACNERSIAGNRYLPRPSDVYRCIVYESTYTNLELVEKTCKEFNLYLPTTDDVISVLKRCSDLYFHDNRYYETYIRPYLDKLTPYHRASICYTLDLYTLRRFNPEFMKKLLGEMIHRTPNDGTNLEDHTEMYSIEEPILYLAHTVHSYEIRGMGKDYEEMNKIGVAKMLYSTSKHIESVLVTYKSFFNCFFMSPTVPINSHRLRNMRRRTVVLSDTDSSGFTMDEWMKWWEGDYIINEDTVGLAGVITYIVASVIINQLSLLSKYLNVEEKNLRVLAMKNEYLWTSFVPAEVSKHYYAYTTIEEGNVFANPSVEVKGVHLKNSAVPTEIIDKGLALMHDILTKIHVNEKMTLVEIVDRVVEVENSIIESVRKGESKFLKKSKIKEASAYAQDEFKSPYQRHKLWVDVFADKYGEIEEPVYDVVKLPTNVTTKTLLNEWLESIEDLELRHRLEKWLKDYNKSSLPTIYLNETYVQGSGIPEEILSVVNIKQVVFDSTLQLRIILETMGLILDPELLIKEQLFVSEGKVKEKVVFKWARVSDKGYECSSKGDKRFSAFYAKMPDGRSIEEHYQVDVKGYSSIKEGKGQKPKDPNTDSWGEYLNLWRTWASNNPVLLEELKHLAGAHNYTLTDMFGHGSVNQARALAEILNETYR